MKTLDEIKQLMAAGDTAGADEALKDLLAKEPDNLQAKILYGTCRQLLGDEETFKHIHDELAPVMERLEKEEPKTETVSLWKKHQRLWEYLIVSGLVLAGVGAAARFFGKEIVNTFNVASVYAGPGYYENQRTDVTNRITPTVQKKFPRDAQSLYAGPGFDDKTIEGQHSGN